jgi:hypothetical protein
MIRLSMTSRAWGVSLVLAMSARASAQGCTTPTNNNSAIRTCSVILTTNAPAGAWVVNKLGVMTLSSAATLTLTSPGSAAFDANMLLEPGGNSRTLTVSANAPWAIDVIPSTASNPSYWTAANNATYGAFVPATTKKSSDDLEVSTTLGSGYLTLPTATTGATTILSGQVPVAARVVTVYFGTIWSYLSDTPGTYTLPFKFTLRIP